MGNAQSQKKTKETKNTLFNEELINSIDLLASKLIFEQSFQNLTKLGNSNYCDEVSILTQKLLKESLDTVNINVISTRVKYGTQDLYVIDDEGFKKLKQVEADRDKAMLCLNVSRFYTRIFQAYSSIVEAINPIYIYKDIEGTEKVRSVFEEISSENKIFRLNTDDFPQTLPAENHVQSIINFTNSYKDNENIVIHCWCGVSRSMATATYLLCRNNTDTIEKNIKYIRNVAPHANPNKLMIKWIGGRQWKKLHFMIYPIALLAILHFFMMVRADFFRPLIYLLIIITLLIYRIWNKYRQST